LWDLTGQENRGKRLLHLQPPKEILTQGEHKMSTTTIKVKILADCEFCDGKAYIPVGVTKDSNGEIYEQYQPCSYCEGSGLRTKYINLVDLIKYLNPSNSIVSIMSSSK
jgi:hypothetical protein